MGSSGSKGKGLSCPSSSKSLSANVRNRRSKVFGVFQSSCLSSRSGPYSRGEDYRGKENEGDVSLNQIQRDGVNMKVDGLRRVKAEKSSGIPYLSSNDEWNQGTPSDVETTIGSRPAQASPTQSSNPSSRTCFRFMPGSRSFRLTRAASLGSSSPYPVSSSSLPVLYKEDQIDLQAERVRALINRDETQEDNGVLLLSQLNGTQTSYNGVHTGDFRLNMGALEISDCPTYNDTTTLARDREKNVGSTEVSAHDQGTCVDTTQLSNGSEHAESRLSDSQGVNCEPIERYCRFNRTLSVGRLRSRVTCRSSSSSSDSPLCPFQQEREESDGSQNSGREVRNVDRRALIPERDEVASSITYHRPPSLSNSLFSFQNYEVQSSRPRESTYYDLLEHSSNFLERRRIIRSQVRALQSLGNRFENVNGHDRSCTLAGQHRSGLCTCTNNRNANSNDNASARASLSRIVLLAESLFEVLDEIHQQSMVLSSRPSASSIRSIPAPNEIVDSLPVKSYFKLHKPETEEVALCCYICLVEYEEGDRMRILPCHHEFHKTCVDKWLKEIQRVCPLCRGDICRSDTTFEN